VKKFQSNKKKIKEFFVNIDAKKDKIFINREKRFCAKIAN
jgi:hypothetical protein